MNKNEKDKKENRQNRAEPQADRKARKPAAAEPQEPAEEIRQEPAEVVGVRFKAGGKVYYFDPGELTLQAGEQVIVETVRGLEFGTVAAGNKTVRASEIVGALKPVVRVATEADIRKNEQNKQLEEGAWAVWAENVKKNGLVMQLVDVEYTFDNSKLIFYFTADGRVDFRELVKDLAGIYRTRIELRQIGVRDEAKLVGGIGVCGRPFCCKSFLSDFAQVSIKMAKEQNLSLSSAKISGACGRLMCCLRFEHEVYEKEYASFPKADTLVSTPAGRGVIVESSFLSGKIKVRLEGDANSPAKVYTKDEIKILGQPRRREQKEPVDDELKKLEDK